MDGDKRTVLVAALSAYVDLLAKNTARLELEEGKGKGKASDDDVDLKAEVQDQIKLCQELTDSINGPAFGKDFSRTFESTEDKSLKGLNHELKETTTWKSQTDDNLFYPAQSYIIEDEPCADPFTGLLIIPETGYEAGPSNRPPPPLRNPPRLPSHKPIRPPPKPLHLQSPTALTRSATLPPQRPPPPPPPPSWDPKAQQLQRRLTVTTKLIPEDNLARRSSISRKPVPTQQMGSYSPSLPYQLPLDSPPPYEESHRSTPYQLVWETETQDNNGGSPIGGTHVPHITRGNYLRHIANLASKALKAAGTKIGTTRAPSLSQSRQLRSQMLADTPPPEYASEAGSTMSRASTRPLRRILQPVPSQESVSSIYDGTSSFGRKSSLASFSSATESSIFTPSTSSSSQADILSPSSSSISFSPSDQDHSIWTASPSASSSTNPNFQFPKPSSWTPAPLMVTVPERSVPSLGSPKLTPDLKGSGTWTSSTTPLRRPSDSFFLKSPIISPEANSQSAYYDRKRSLSSASIPTISRRTRSSSTTTPILSSGATPPTDGLERSYAVEPEPNLSTTSNTFSDNTLSRNSKLDKSISMAEYRLGVTAETMHNNKPSLDPQGRNELQSASRPPFVPPGSKNTSRGHMAADEAFAKSLQQEEYRNIQMERDQLLAYALANGTVQDDDLEIAYFMARETASLIASTDAVPRSLPAAEPSIPTGFDLCAMDPRTSQLQLDLFEARQLEEKLRAQEAANEASLSEAKRLQAEYDKEIRNEEAWEDWKKSNIEECIVCRDEQHREELLRPCEHGYCEGCLQEGFKNALTSRTPFKCCKSVLSIEDCSGLSDDFMTEYEEMMLELTTPNPMYCCNARCAKFLPPSAIVGDIGFCVKCRMRTCRYCRKRIHPGTFCKEDKETEAVKKLAKAKGWKTCPGCNHLIERWAGCLHMTCSRCRTAFCYRCSKPWKDCESTCPDVPTQNDKTNTKTK